MNLFSIFLTIIGIFVAIVTADNVCNCSGTSVQAQKPKPKPRPKPKDSSDDIICNCPLIPAK